LVDADLPRLRRCHTVIDTTLLLTEVREEFGR
jgi:hypothetical protein